MLGREIIRYCESQNIEIDNTYVDISSVEPKDIRCGIVINCSGHAPSIEGRAKMVLVNQIGPKRLADVCDSMGSRLVHISTDAVFNHNGPHNEMDFCDPSSTYGRTKMIGEVKKHPHLTVRTSFIGIGQRGIVTQITMTKDIIKASEKFLWNGHTAATVAKALVTLALKKDVTGLIHMPGRFYTRYDLVTKLFKLFEEDESRVILDNSYICDRRLISTRWKSIGMEFPQSLDEQLVDLMNTYNGFRDRGILR